MSFPVVAATNTSAQSLNATSHPLALPAGIAAGNLLIAIFGFKGGTGVSIVWPSGWTQFFRANRLTNVGVAAAYRQATGGEGNTITVTTSTSVKSTHNSYRITGHENPAVRPPEGAGADGNNINPDPPLLTPTVGAKDYLWLAVEINNDDTISISSFPAGYTDGIQIAAGAACNTGSARRALNAALEDPGVFTLTSSIAWAAGTLVVHPAVARRAQVSFAEMEIPDLAPRRAQISFAEMETAVATRQAWISFAEMEVPDDPSRRAQISFAEMETTLDPRSAQISFAEMETTLGERAAQISFAEIEVPDTPFRRGRVSFAVMIVPSPPSPGAGGGNYPIYRRRRIGW